MAWVVLAVRGVVQPVHFKVGERAPALVLDTLECAVEALAERVLGLEVVVVGLGRLGVVLEVKVIDVADAAIGPLNHAVLVDDRAVIKLCVIELGHERTGTPDSAPDSSAWSRQAMAACMSV